MLKNITFSVEEKDIAAARDAAASDNMTLNEAARLWIKDYGERRRRHEVVDVFFQKLEGLRLERKYSRDELNER